MTELILIRHGETSWNAERRIQGQLDAPLNETGLAQAKAVGERFRNSEIDILVSSDLSRAMHTMNAVARFHGLPIISEPRLRERHLGILQGLSYADAERDLNEVLDVFRLRHIDAPIKDGESLREFADRVVEVLTELAVTYPDQRVVAVTHGGVVEIALRYANKLPLDAPRESPIYNTSVNTFHATASKLELIDWGDVRHLHEQLALDDL